MPRLPLAVITALLAAMVSSTPAFAAAPVEPVPAKQYQAIGAYVSNIAGSGITYHRRFDNGWGFHLSGIGWGQSGSMFVNAGGALTRMIDQREWGGLYGLAAIGAGIGSFSGGGGMQGSQDLQVNFAPGIGLQFGPLIAEIGYSFYTNPQGPGFTPAGGVGLAWWF